jgi:hypothetical protein
MLTQKRATVKVVEIEVLAQFENFAPSSTGGVIPNGAGFQA